MAENDSSIFELFVDAIGDTIAAVKSAPDGEETLRYAQAVNELAQAYGWISRDDQSHGTDGGAA